MYIAVIGRQPALWAALGPLGHFMSGFRPKEEANGGRRQWRERLQIMRV